MIRGNVLVRNIKKAVTCNCNKKLSVNNLLAVFGQT